MPEVNEVLDQAIREVEGVTEAAEEAREGVKRLQGLGEALADRLESRMRDSRASLAELGRKAGLGGGGLQERAQAVLSGLRSLGSRHAEGKVRTDELLDRVLEGFADLRQDHDHVLDAAEGQARAAEAELAELTERVRRLDADAESRFQEMRDAIAALTEKAGLMRDAVRERREALLQQILDLEASARQKLEGALQSFDALGARLESQVGEVVAGLQGHADRATDVVAEKFEREGGQRLLAAGDALKTRIRAFEEFATRQRQRLGEQLRRLEDAGKDVESTCVEIDRNVRLH
jgi:hypothetical protein